MLARPTPEQDAEIRRAAARAGAAAPPPRPLEGECCERFCEPCVWDYYVRALERWAERHGLDDVVSTITSPANE